MGPKIGPRWPQDRFKTILKGVFFRLRFCLRFLVGLGSHFGSILALFWSPRPPACPTLTAPKRPKATQGDPRAPKMRPRPSQDRPKIKKIEFVERCREKVDHAHPQFSLNTIARKNRKPFATLEPQRVAAVVARSALQSAAPGEARHGVLRVTRSISSISNVFKYLEV